MLPPHIKGRQIFVNSISFPSLSEHTRKLLPWLLLNSRFCASWLWPPFASPCPSGATSGKDRLFLQVLAWVWLTRATIMQVVLERALEVDSMLPTELDLAWVQASRFPVVHPSTKLTAKVLAVVSKSQLLYCYYSCKK